MHIHYIKYINLRVFQHYWSNAYLIHILLTILLYLINCPVDNDLNLDTMLTQLGSHIASKWYQFGLAAGIPNEILDKLLEYPSEQCVIEILDYWLKSWKDDRPTWKDVAEILTAIGYQHLAEHVLKVYKTGKLLLEEML